jgi:DNA-binding CsgD family transcriptional regulator
MMPYDLARAKEAYERQAWGEAYAGLLAAGRDRPLDPSDLERLAVAAHLTGREAESREALTRAHNASLQNGDAARAARFAFWLGHALMFAGEMGQANGWFGRARRLLEENALDCVERGYLLVPGGIERVESDPAAAAATFREAQATGRRFADPDLVAIAGHGLGRSLIRLGRVADGMAALDEVMVAVAAGEVSPMVVGDVYCGVMEACHEVFDLRRAREWTAALSRWCEGQPDLVPYRGPCLVHRAEVMQLQGAWGDAMDEARRACALLSGPPAPEAAAAAYYRLAELYRLRGDFARAEEAYRQASRLGHAPEPGIARLWLARGQGAAAATAIRRVLDEAQDPARRAELLAAQVEILLAGNDLAGARVAANELSEVAERLDSPLLRATAGRAEGAVLLGEGDARAALRQLRRAWTAWQKLDAPHEAARTRVLIGEACRALGDEESAEMEWDAARWIFQHLEAAPDLARVDALSRPAATGTPGGLTARELEVLKLVAAGRTNREIGAALVISEHTVARHLQNIFTRLGLPSRTALTAFAFEHGIV